MMVEFKDHHEEAEHHSNQHFPFLFQAAFGSRGRTFAHKYNSSLIMKYLLSDNRKRFYLTLPNTLKNLFSGNKFICLFVFELLKGVTYAQKL